VKINQVILCLVCALAVNAAGPERPFGAETASDQDVSTFGPTIPDKTPPPSSAATGYLPIAERTPAKEEYPDAPPENLVAGFPVFTPTPYPVSLKQLSAVTEPLGYETDMFRRDYVKISV